MRQFPAVVAPSLGVWKKNQSVQDPPINALSLNLGAGGGGSANWLSWPGCYTGPDVLFDSIYHGSNESFRALDFLKI